jgi:hypothetical protein
MRLCLEEAIVARTHIAIGSVGIAVGIGLAAAPPIFVDGAEPQGHVIWSLRATAMRDEFDVALAVMVLLVFLAILAMTPSFGVPEPTGGVEIGAEP